MELELARAIERLLTTCFGAMSIVLAWNLFRIGVVDPQVAKLAGMGATVSLQRVGPGAFFSLFGAAILVSSLSRPLSIERRPVSSDASADNAKVPSSPQDSKEPLQEKFVYGIGEPGPYSVEVARAIGSLTTFQRSVRNDCLTPHQSEQLSQAAGRLERFRKEMAIALFGRERIATYEKYIGNADQADEKDKENLSQVDPWMSGTLADGDGL